MAAPTHPSRLTAALWLLLIFGSVIAISWYAWSVINRQPSPTTPTTQQPEDSDANTFNIDEQLDMLNQ